MKWINEKTVQGDPMDTKNYFIPKEEYNIRHGHWIPLYPREEPITNLFKCSVCGMGYEDDDTDCQVYFEWDYCPHCGAKMDEVEE